MGKSPQSSNTSRIVTSRTTSSKEACASVKCSTRSSGSATPCLSPSTASREASKSLLASNRDMEKPYGLLPSTPLKAILTDRRCQLRRPVSAPYSRSPRLLSPLPQSILIHISCPGWRGWPPSYTVFVHGLGQIAQRRRDLDGVVRSFFKRPQRLRQVRQLVARALTKRSEGGSIG